MTPPLRVVMLSFRVTEETGGPGVAAAGFASGLARLGADVTLVAFDEPAERWLVTEEEARRGGFTLVRLPQRSWVARLHAMSGEVTALRLRGGRGVLWVNGIWGAQSVAAWSASSFGRVPYVLRPAGSLGHAALARKALKKRLYWTAVESHVARRAAALHCLSPREVEELPAWLRERSFVVPSGVDLPAGPLPPKERGLVGVLARIHPIKNHGLALDAVERLVASGRDLRLELAGSASDPGHEAALRRRIEGSPILAGRVRLLGHVEKSRIPSMVGRWQAALLPSDQENFGHAVISAAACGVPTVVSPGVGIGAELEAAGAGIVARRGGESAALAQLLERAGPDLERASQAFARSFSWEASSRALLDRLARLARAAR